MRPRSTGWARVLLAVLVASLVTIAHHPPAQAQNDPGAPADAGPFASGNASTDASGSNTPDSANTSDDSSDPGGPAPTGAGSDQSSSDTADTSGSSDSSGVSPADLAATGINLSDAGASNSGSSNPSLSSSTTLAAGPFGATSVSISPQVGSSPGSNQSTGGSQGTSAQAAPTVQPTGPDQVVSARTAVRAAAGSRLLGIWSVADILAFLAALLTAIVVAIATALSGLLQAILGGPQGVIFQTPPELTFQLGPVVGAWNAMRLIAEAGLALVVMVAGYEVMFGHHIGLPAMGPAQVVPRVMLGFILIHFSLDWSAGLLQLNNALSHMLLGPMPTDWDVQPGAHDLGAAVVWLFEIVMMLLLALSMWLRIGLLDVLLPLGPLMLLLWTSPLTSDWGEWWLGLFTSTALVQFVQDIGLWLGSQMLTAGGQNASQGLSKRLLAFVLMLLVFRLPQLMPAMAASGGTASLLGVSRGVDAIGSLPVLGGALGAPARLMGIGGARRAGGSRGGRGKYAGGNDGARGKR